jgi:hypothetical protein
VAVIVKLKSGNWRVQVRRKGKYASRTFLRKCDAEGWAVQAERDIDQGKRPAQPCAHIPALYFNDCERRLKDRAGASPTLHPAFRV